MATIGFFFKKKKKFAQLPEFIYFLTSSEPVICLEYFVDFLNKVKFSFSTNKHGSGNAVCGAQPAVCKGLNSAG